MATANFRCRHCCGPSRSFSSLPVPRFRKVYRVISLKPRQIPIRVSVTLSVTKFSIRKKTSNLSLSAVLSSDSVPDSNDERIGEGRETVRKYLEQVGASTADAHRISSNCPNYLKMLIDGVDDLDHWNSLAAASSSGEEVAEDASNFKRKVYQMAEQKGDNGLLPFLESLGLSLSSATHLARYVFSSGSYSLPALIHKVNHLKEILFSGSDNPVVLGRNARRMMTHLSISADEDVQQTLAFFEKIQARRGGLDLLGSESPSLRCLIESFSRLLIHPSESRTKPMVTLLRDVGVPEQHVRNVFLLFPPILLYDLEKVIKPRLKLFEKIGAKDGELGKMLVKYPWILSAGILENSEKILNFFDEEKVPATYSWRAIQNWPHILGSSVGKLRQMMDYFRAMGIETQKLSRFIAKSPQLLLRKPQELDQMVSFFEDLELDGEAIARTLVRCPEIFAANRERTLQKKLAFLYDEAGIPKSYLPKIIRKYPELFVCDVDRAMLPRMNYLMTSGLSKKEVAGMVHRFSPLLGYSIEQVLRPKMEFLVNTMQKPVRELVEYPRYFSYSLEKKIKPRFWVLKSRNVDFTLREMLAKNDDEFAEEHLDGVSSGFFRTLR